MTSRNDLDCLLSHTRGTALAKKKVSNRRYTLFIESDGDCSRNDDGDGSCSITSADSSGQTKLNKYHRLEHHLVVTRRWLEIQGKIAKNECHLRNLRTSIVTEWKRIHKSVRRKTIGNPSTEFRRSHYYIPLT